jgi:hypothetical protein
MSACPTLTFSNITPENYAQLVKKAQESGVPLQGHSGTGSSFGGHFEWNYDPASLILTITVTHPPFLMGCESVNARIAAMVTSLAD